MYNLVKYLLTMQQVFEQLIRQLVNPASVETKHAMSMLNTAIPDDIPTIIIRRITREPLFFNSMLYDNFQDIERVFATKNVPEMNADLWVNFVTQVRGIVRPQPQRQRDETNPVLGRVHPMPPVISLATAARIEQEIDDEAGPRLGGKRSRLRSKKRGRKSIHRRKKSMHKKRK